MGRVTSFFCMTQNGGRCAVWRSLDLPARWLRPIHLDYPSTTSHYSPLHVRRGGVHLQNLRSLNRVSTPVIFPPPSRMALINAQSLVSKTFSLLMPWILCSSQKLGDLCPFSIIYVAFLSAKFKYYSYCTTDSFLFFPLV